MKPWGLRKTSSPKLVVPQVSEQESGSASSTVSRFSSGSWTLPPVESCTTRDVCSRRASTAALRCPWSSVGRCSASRMCRWIIDAPAASHETAVSTSSSSVVGSCGKSPLESSAPVGATVIRVPGVVAMADIMAAPRTGAATPSGCDDLGLRSGDAVDGKGRVERGVALDQREPDGAVLVVAGDRGEVPDGTVAEQYRRPPLGQRVARPVEVQGHQPARRAAQVVHPGDGLLAAVAALVQ